ncbi:MAG: M23 family metallopeptidase [Haloechinothrix sp.]
MTTRSFRVFALLAALPILVLGAAMPVAATPQPRPVAVAQEARFFWPLAPQPDVLRTFARPLDPYGPGHRGVDLGAEPGRPVYAAAPGVVVYAGALAGRGVVSIDHDTLRTTYEPVDPSVSVGDQVYAGQEIGVVTAGHPDCPVSACLHWGVRRGAEYLDPLQLVGERSEIRLKPWSG